MSDILNFKFDTLGMVVQQVAPPLHISRVPTLSLSSGCCMCRVLHIPPVSVGYLMGSLFPRTSEKHASKCILCSKLPISE